MDRALGRGRTIMATVRLPAGNFSDEVLRWLLRGNSLLLLRKTCSSHSSGLILFGRSYLKGAAA
jgi:hypothetical protein